MESFVNYFNQYSISAQIVIILGIAISLLTAIFFAPSKKPENINIVIQPPSLDTGDWNITVINTPDLNMSIYILGEDFNWKYESCSKIEKNGKPIELQNYLSYKGVISRLATSVDIIAVGLSSQEGEYPDIEKERADLRAKYLKGLLEKNIKSKAEFHKLVIGQYIGKNINSNSPKSTNFQRPIIIIGVHKKNDKVSFEKALKKALQENKKIPIVLKDYKQFKFNEYIQPKHFFYGCE